MSHQSKVLILLSTYNGERYLDEQLKSLLDQSWPEIMILVRDDGSSDDSRKILADYSIRYPERFHFLRDEAGNLGACGSFAWLVNYALEHKQELGLDPLYMMFCDQDDVWYEDKVARQMNAMLATEDELADDHSVPILIHTDLQVVAEDGQPIADSLASYQGLETERNSFPNMVISNLVTGCTALFNEALARRALPIPQDAIMHDWWMALIASAFGKVVYLDTPLIHYRQHGANTIGAKQKESQGPGSISFWRKLFGPAANEHLYEVALQARAFRNQFSAELDKRNRLALTLNTLMATRIGFVQRAMYRLARRF
jgi:glycosyltransferase involved in cell wall biosynthesis